MKIDEPYFPTVSSNQINDLQFGNERQKKAYFAIQQLNLFNKLSKYSPFLAGTIPLDIDVDSSDLDIICESVDIAEFESTLKFHFEELESFTSYTQNVRDVPTFIACFKYLEFDFEFFCQSVPVRKQCAYIHFVIEFRLLTLGGVKAHESIRHLKRQGIKTEPAFALYFKLAGDPYEELAKMIDFSDRQLQEIIDSVHS
ncbi:MAG: DUF4269 domain-containing protein [Bacteriovorax sp.]|nr:DUF4269 domain-containing protein [Bacteriovorax sp.]